MSEGALHRTRAEVQLKALVAFSQSNMPRRPELTDADREKLLGFYSIFHFDPAEVAMYDHFGKNGIGPLEHDVKAVETTVRRILRDNGYGFLQEWVHFPMTSEDVNNLAWNLMLRRAINRVWLPALLEMMDTLAEYATAYAEVPVLGVTHGMKASPTTFGKRFGVHLEGLRDFLKALSQLRLTGKFSGPVGNHNAMVAIVPEFDIETFARDFVGSFGFVYEDITHQRNSHRAIMQVLAQINFINHELMNLCENIRHSVMMGWIEQIGEESHVGSSVMPHKINPWFFEVAQGYLEQYVAMINGAGMGLLISVFERDLTDHPWERAYGEMLAKSLIGIRYIALGLGTLRVNDTAALKELKAAPEVMAEAIQIAGRISGEANIYTTIKQLTRGRKLTTALLRTIIKENVSDPEMRGKLLRLRTENYVGEAAELGRRATDRYRPLRARVETGILDANSHIRAVLFDLDGTLHFGDKEELQARLEAINQELKLGFSPEELHDIGNRSDWKEMMHLLVERHHATERITYASVGEANARISGKFDDRFFLADHARELLDLLKQKGIKLGLVTTRGPNSLPRVLRQHQIADYFDIIIDRSSCERRKPHPAPIAMALEALEITDPSTAIYVGDLQEDDVIAGKAFGLETVLVTEKPLDPYGAQPDFHFSNLRPLLERFSR